MYPKKIEANGNIYEINTDFRVALACFRAINDEEITELEKFYAVETLLLGANVDPKDSFILNQKIQTYLRCGQTENIEDNEINFDYIQDEEYVRTSIRQCYQINLNNIPYMHWYEYNELIAGLTEDTLLSKIREIRSYDLSEVKDENQRKKIIEAKEKFAIKRKTIKTEKEKEIDIFWDTILN